jgi:hypothetical protein
MVPDWVGKLGTLYLPRSALVVNCRLPDLPCRAERLVGAFRRAIISNPAQSKRVVSGLQIDNYAPRTSEATRVWADDDASAARICMFDKVRRSASPP